ncbi:MAG: LCP family protein [Candidatus Komeilibacteria bacterium]
MSEFQSTSFSSPQPTPRPRAGRSRTKFFSCLFILLIIVFWLLTAIINLGTKNFLTGIGNGYYVRQIGHILNPGANQLHGESQDRINFLLLGMGGPGHDGPYLADTIILASFKPSTKQVAVVSIPRDLIVPFGDGTYRKVNSIYALTREQGRDYAFTQIKSIFKNSFDLDIDYLTTIDFQGFVDIIDSVGNITVTVDNAFTDNQFPTSDYKVQAVSFQTGKQKMDGLTTLRFARSRHGNNGEGSDFARSRRQQKILLALKDKITSFNTLINPVKITTLFNILTQYTSTDMEPWEAVKLAQMAKDIPNGNLTHVVLDDGPGNFLIGGISAIDGAYILQPKTGNYLELQKMLATIFDRPQVDKEQAVILLQNGTAVPGLATLKVNELGKLGLSVARFGNANKSTFVSTQIYDYTNGAKPQTLKVLTDYFQTTASTNPPIEFLNYTVAKQWNMVDDKGQIQPPDFLVIVGANSVGSSFAATSTEIIKTVAPTTTVETLFNTTN